MNSSGEGSSGGSRAPDLFEDLWKQLKDCHQHAIAELESKVSKLKKDRCLDAQRLEVFYNRNQQLKEENQFLHNTITLLEERLRTGECDQCVLMEEKLKNSLDQNVEIVDKLNAQINNLNNENDQLRTELQKPKAPSFESKSSSPEHEDGVIPDSPLLPSSLPAANKLRKRKHDDKAKRIRYEEKPLPNHRKSLLCDSQDAPKDPGKAEVLVPNTCELDASPTLNGEDLEGEETETCGFELVSMKPANTESTPLQRNNSKFIRKFDIRLKPYPSPSSSTLVRSPDSTTEKSPSLLPSFKCFANDSSLGPVKRKKEENHAAVGKESKNFSKLTLLDLTNCNKMGECAQSGRMQGSKVPLSESVAHTLSVSPAFKKPLSVGKGASDGRTKTQTQRDRSKSQCQPESKEAPRKPAPEPAWSIDPALAFSTCDAEGGDEEMTEKQHQGELADTDCTWVSHSMLQQQDRAHKSGLGAKAMDSLDMMFDTTAYGEYKSFNSSSAPQSEDDDDDEEERQEQEEEQTEGDFPENYVREGKAREPTFAHVAVVRKKDERRKLKGTTCKECEIYYAHMPEDQREKHLSSCSRHRYLYVPPSTPENFWEVGFPSTQTCVERGYIKEENGPTARSRRRLPLNALFTPKKNQQQS